MGNNGKAFWMWFLIIIIFILGGYIFYDKVIALTDKNNNKFQNKAQEDVKKEEQFDLTEAKKLVNKYVSPLMGSYLFEESYNDNIKVIRAIDSILNDKMDFANCGNIYNADERVTKEGELYFITEPTGGEIGYCDNNSKIVSFEDVQREYQNLYGNNQTPNKKTVHYLLRSYDYNPSLNAFIELHREGGSGVNDEDIYVVNSATKRGNNLVIDVLYQYFNYITNDNDKYAVGLDGLTLKITRSEVDSILKDSSSFVNQYKDLMDKYRFTFIKEDDHYYLDSVIKILY